MESITRFLEKRLRVKVNRDKSAVDRPWRRDFLGYAMTWHRQPKLKVSPDSIQRIRSKIRELMWEARAVYFDEDDWDEFPRLLRGMDQLSSGHPREYCLKNWMDGIDQRLRCVIWQHWKKRRTRARSEPEGDREGNSMHLC